MQFKQWLDISEVHYKDYYGPKFDEFKKKYAKYKSDTTLFVHFTDHSTDTLDRQAFANPNHRDPVGTYAYPLKYVIEYPSDIWYGSSARYIRVIKATAMSNSVSLQNMEEWWARSLLNKAGISPYDLAISQKAFKHAKGAGRVGKQFFQAVQHDLSIPPKKEVDGWNSIVKKYTMRTPQEQTAILRKMGITILIDNAKTPNQAVINSREPQQAIFLNPMSFKVLEVFDTGKRTARMGIGTSRLSIYGDIFFRKLAAKITEKLDDKITERNDKFDKDYGTSQHYFTKKGREIELSQKLPYSYMKNRKMGEKKHKEFGQSDVYQIAVKISGERGTFETTFWTSDTFDEIADSAVKSYLAKEPVADFQPATLASHKANQAEQERLASIKRWEEQEAEDAETEKSMQPLMQQALNKEKIPLVLNLNKKWYRELNFFHRIFRSTNSQESFENRLKDTWKTYNTAAEASNKYFLRENDPETQKIMQLYKKILEKSRDAERFSLNYSTFKDIIDSRN